MLRRNEAGAAAVEFALVLLPLLLLVFGIIEFGITLYEKQLITQASGVGATAGPLFSNPPTSDAAIRTMVSNYLTATGLNAGNATINVDCAPAGNPASFGKCNSSNQNSSDYMKVGVQYIYRWQVLHSI